jgi:hypothetical protein
MKNLTLLFTFLSIMLAASPLLAGLASIQNEDVKSLTDITAAVLTTTGNLTSGSACISSPGSTTGLATGLYVYDTTTSANIPSGTTIAGLPGTCSAGQIQMSANATGTATGDTITFGGQKSQLINDTKIYVTANSINDQLSNAITTGQLGGSGSGGGFNMLSSYNPGFESGTTNWTNSGGTFTTTTTAANVGFGSKSASFVTSAGSQTLSSNLIAIPSGLYGQNGLVSCYIQTAATDFTLSVTDGTNTIASTTITGLGASTYGYFPLNFIFPSSGSVKLVLTSGSAKTAYLDNCYLGSAANLTNVSQAFLVGGVVINGCSSAWSTTSTTLTDFSTQSGCTYTAFGAAQAPSTNIPAVKFASLPPGEYKLEYQGTIDSLTQGFGSYYQFWDGTNTARELSQLQSASGGVIYSPGINQSISYTSAQSNVTFSIRGKVDSGGTARLRGTNSHPGVIRVYYYPSQTSLALTPNILSTSWSGYISGCASNPTLTSTSYADFSTPASCAVTELTNVNFTTPTVANGAGLTFTPKTTGRYLIIATGMFGNGGTTNSTQVALTDGSNNVLDASGNFTANATTYSSATLVGVLNVTSLASQTVKIRGLNTNSNVVTNYASSTANSTWKIINISQSLPAPILTGSVATNSSGQEQIGRAFITNNGTCAVSSQSGSWIASISRSAVGRCDITFATGYFSATPVCVYSPVLGDKTIFSTSISSTDVIPGTSTIGTGFVDSNYYIICMGPK